MIMICSTHGIIVPVLGGFFPFFLEKKKEKKSPTPLSRIYLPPSRGYHDQKFKTKLFLKLLDMTVLTENLVLSAISTLSLALLVTVGFLFYAHIHPSLTLYSKIGTFPGLS